MTRDPTALQLRLLRVDNGASAALSHFLQNVLLT